MKRRIAALCLAVLGLLLGLGAHAEEKTVEYTNLAEAETQERLAEVMTEAGIAQTRQAVFFEHVEQMNAVLRPEEKTEGFETLPIASPQYDPYAVQERWTEAYPDFFGYNCRITAYSLFGAFVTVPEQAEIRDDLLPFDLLALEEDASALTDGGSKEAFSALFSAVPTERTKDIRVHAQNLQADWAARGITFEENEKASLITVVFHEALDEPSRLFIGHTGVLFPLEEGGLYFVEKLSFQEPYQCVRLKDRADLQAYLMAKYDVDYNQPTAAPFIMENDRMLKTD